MGNKGPNNGRMSSRDKILQEIESFLVRSGMTPWKFGKRSVGEGKFVQRLRGGMGMTLDSADKVRAFMAENKHVRPVRAAKKRVTARFRKESVAA